MKRSFLKFVSAAFIGMVYYGCSKPKTYSDIPAIQFVSLTTQRGVLRPDSNSIITISFTDGDGDIGYNQAPGNGNPYDDTLSIYYDDFVVSFYEKKSGEWVKDTVGYQYGRSPFSGRLPYLTPTGTNKALTGQIAMTQLIWTYPVLNDTIRYEVYIYDRALHQSNTITTSEIVINTAP